MTGSRHLWVIMRVAKVCKIVEIRNCCVGCAFREPFVMVRYLENFLKMLYRNNWKDKQKTNISKLEKKKIII